MGQVSPFRSFRFEAFILKHPELEHVRTKVKSPGQNGSREHGFGTLTYERLSIDEIVDAVMLAKHPNEVHLGLASPTIPKFQTTENLPTS